MAKCSSCGRPIELSPLTAIRAGEHMFHLGCAPPRLLTEAAEEYEAILRKGIRYFVEKYHVGSVDVSRPDLLFSAMGAAFEAERARRRAAES